MFVRKPLLARGDLDGTMFALNYHMRLAYDTSWVTFNLHVHNFVATVISKL